MQTIYISEPKVIASDIVTSLLPNDRFSIIEGTPEFDGDSLDAVEVLMIRSGTTVSAGIKSVFPNLKHIVRVGVGVDNVDLEYCKQAGIAVYNAPGANSDAVSDYVVAMMFHALRNIYAMTDEDVADWNRFKFTGHSMAGRTIGIVGFGNIGKQIFRKLSGFACKGFYVYDPFVSPEDMPEGVTYAATVDEVLRNADVVTLHVPLLPATQYMVNAANLGLLREGSILINASRGGIVNENDIIPYARDKKLIYIADTVENEPHVSRDLMATPNVVVTPHIASLTHEAGDNMVRVALQNFLSNQPMKLT